MMSKLEKKKNNLGTPYSPGLVRRCPALAAQQPGQKMGETSTAVGLLARAQSVGRHLQGIVLVGYGRTTKALGKT